MAAIAGIELGGTNTMWGVASADGPPSTSGELATTTPERTIAAALAAILAACGGKPPCALGVGAFGPVELDRDSPRFGVVLATPKPGWPGADLPALVARSLAVPVVIDTDVNAAALGELRHGAGRGLRDLIYVTVGTGVGGGAVVAGELVRGAGHPEMGHVRVPLHQRDLAAGFAGICPRHGSCLEGLACGPALEARYGCPPAQLPPDHEAWEVEVHYIAHALCNLVLVYRPQRIVLGGGVVRDSALRERIRMRLVELVDPGYVEIGDGSQLVVVPALGELAGVTGAISLAAQRGPAAIA